MDASEILDARDAAEYLKINEQTVRRLARDSEIPAFKVGGSWRFKRSSLDRWAASQESRPARHRMLVVDDEEAIRNIIRRTFEKLGFEVDDAGGAHQILERLEGSKPDIIILDLNMPEMDGPAVLERVRARWGEVPVIVLTGYPESALMERALQFSPITLLSKPSSSELIVRTVRSILSGGNPA
jgi:excisionase family DNA binding protein